MIKLRGTGAALVTPFKKNKSVDFDSLKRLIEHVISGGVEFIVAMGTTAETATLNSDEKNKIISFITKQVKGRIPIVLGIGGNHTEHILETIKTTNFTNISAILSVSPYYNKPNQQGLFEHYSKIAKACPVPIILYNVPGRTGMNMLPDTTLKLARTFKNIVAIKEASGNIEQIMQIIENKPSHFEVFSGDDSISLPLISIGVVGVISVTAISIPRYFSDLVRLALEGKFAEAKTIHYKILELTRLMFAEGNPTGVKAALTKQKIIENNLRLPLVPASKELQTKIDRWVDKYLV